MAERSKDVWYKKYKIREYHVYFLPYVSRETGTEYVNQADLKWYTVTKKASSPKLWAYIFSSCPACSHTGIACSGYVTQSYIVLTGRYYGASGRGRLAG